jgi:hypothetical protein
MRRGEDERRVYGRTKGRMVDRMESLRNICASQLALNIWTPLLLIGHRSCLIQNPGLQKVNRVHKLCSMYVNRTHKREVGGLKCYTYSKKQLGVETPQENFWYSRDTKLKENDIFRI